MPKPIEPEAFEGFTADVYFDSKSGKYLVKNASGRWLDLSRANLFLHLSKRGVGISGNREKDAAERTSIILDTQDHRDISGYGPLCGRNSGFFNENGVRYLVTEDMTVPQPVAGRWNNLQAVIKGLFWDSETEEVGKAQTAALFGWFRSSVKALRAGKYQQQQALALCGKAGCGKSMLQHLLTEMLAGREVKAARYLQGRTDFNADLFQAEHLVLEDDHCSSRITDRLRLGASLKEICVGSTVASLHAKGRDAINIRPWWRVSITLNDDPEAMMILPPLDEHIADKIILLRASRFDWPMPMGTTEEQAACRRRLASEIPAFLHWLLNDYELEPQYRDERRYGVKTFHHPDLKEALEELSPEADLLDLLDRTFFANGFDTGPVGPKSAKEIQRALEEEDATTTNKLLHFRNACGTLLGRLASRKPERVEKAQRSASRRGGWIIRPPKEED